MKRWRAAWRLSSIRGLGQALALGVTVGALIGCVQSEPTLDQAPAAPTRPPGPAVSHPPANPKSCAEAEKHGPTLFVSDVGSNEIVCFTEKNGVLNAVGSITQGISLPFGLTVDGNGRLYVANGGTHSVNIYEPGKGTPSTTLVRGITNPVAIAVDGRGTVYVSNSSPPSVAIFPKGKTFPSAIVTRDLAEPYGIALDRSGTLYVADYSGRGVLRLTRDSNAPKRLPLSGIDRPVGIALDSKGNLYVSEAHKSVVVVYHPPFGKPARTITSDVNGPYFVAFDPTGVLYVPNANGGNVASYGASGPPHLSGSNRLHVPVGIAAYWPTHP